MSVSFLLSNLKFDVIPTVFIVSILYLSNFTACFLLGLLLLNMILLWVLIADKSILIKHLCSEVKVLCFFDFIVLYKLVFGFLVKLILLARMIFDDID